MNASRSLSGSYAQPFVTKAWFTAIDGQTEKASQA